MSDQSWPVGLKKFLDEAWAYFVVLGGVVGAVGLGYIPVTEAAETKPWLGLATAVGYLLVLFGLVGAANQLKTYVGACLAKKSVASAVQKQHKALTPKQVDDRLKQLFLGLSGDSQRLWGQIHARHVALANPNHPATRELLRQGLIEPTRGDDIQELHAALNEGTPYRFTEKGLAVVTAIEVNVRQA